MNGFVALSVDRVSPTCFTAQSRESFDSYSRETLENALNEMSREIFSVTSQSGIIGISAFFTAVGNVSQPLHFAFSTTSLWLSKSSNALAEDKVVKTILADLKVPTEA